MHLWVWGVIILAAAGVVWWFVPKWQAKHLSAEIQEAKDRANLEDNYRKTVGQMLGIVITLGGAGLAYNQPGAERNSGSE
jgi:hypothetical protein